MIFIAMTLWVIAIIFGADPDAFENAVGDRWPIFIIMFVIALAGDLRRALRK